MKAAQQGFTLIELMISVAIVGILASVALPAYQNYTSTATVSTCFTQLSSSKTGVTNIFYREGQASNPTMTASALNLLQDQSCAATSVVSADDGSTTTLTGTVTTIASFPNETLTFTLERTHSDGTWECELDASTSTAADLNESGVVPKSCTAI